MSLLFGKGITPFSLLAWTGQGINPLIDFANVYLTIISRYLCMIF